jgi:hypothetical protein
MSPYPRDAVLPAATVPPRTVGVMIRRLISVVILFTVAAPAAAVVAHGGEDTHAGPLTVSVVGPAVASPCNNAYVSGSQIRLQGQGFLPSSRVTVAFASPIDGLVTYPVLTSTADGLIDADLVLPRSTLTVATVGLLTAKGKGPDGHDPVLSAQLPLQAADSFCGKRLTAAGVVTDSAGRAPAADPERPVLRPGGSPVTSQIPAAPLPWTLITAGVVLIVALGFLAFAIRRRRGR